MRNIVLRFDMRSAPQCPETPAERYRTVLDMSRWADQNTVDVIGLSEHHNTEDVFLSAPLQLAEDITLLDRAGGGRFSATCGLDIGKVNTIVSG